MDWAEDGRGESRGTILVASRDGLFADIVGEMVTACGFTAAYPEESEPAWLAVARTQPCIAICDCEAPVIHIQRLFIEASTRAIPLLLTRPRAEHNLERALALARQVVWLAFPVSRDTFCSMLNDLLAPLPQAVHRVTGSIAGVGLDAGVSVGTLVP